MNTSQSASPAVPEQRRPAEPCAIHHFGCLEVRETAAVDRLTGTVETSVVLRGELDMAAAPGLRDLLTAALQRTGAVRIDAALVSFIDSTGIHALLASQRRATLLGAALHLERPSERVCEVLRITGLDAYFDL